jgi:hypothetical protein
MFEINELSRERPSPDLGGLGSGEKFFSVVGSR